MSSSTKAAKPGAKLKQRKGVAKASAKFEPGRSIASLVALTLAEDFRDSLVEALQEVPEGSYDGYAAKLDALGQELDYRRYEEQFFQVLLLGHLLAPGGGFVQDGAPASPFSVLGSAKEPVSVADVKPIVEVFEKLIRRYKYLQLPLEQVSLPQILQYINRFDALPAEQKATILKPQVPDIGSNPPSRVATPTPTAQAAALPGRPNQDKIATALALFVTSDLCAPKVISSLKKDHLVKDGTSLSFLTTYARAYLTVEPIDSLTSSLRKGGIDDILDFFPPPRRSIAELGLHFKKAGLDGLAEYYQKQRSVSVAKDTLVQLRELVASNAPNEEILAFLKEQNQHGAMAEGDFITVIWDGLLSAIDVDATPAEQLGDVVLKEVKSDEPILSEYAKSAKAQIGLINSVQVWCFGNSHFMPFFPKILRTLYAEDVVSDQAIVYWYNKGSNAKGRSHFLAATKPLVTFLEQQAEESD